MLTRSSHASSSTSSRSSYGSRKSLPSISTRSHSRKRKVDSNPLKEEDLLNRLSVVEERSRSHHTRHSVSSSSTVDSKYMVNESGEEYSRRRILSRRTRLSLPAEECQVNPSRDYCRRLVDVDDYDTRSTISSSSSISVGNSSIASYCTRRSSKRSHSDRESLLSGISSIDSSVSVAARSTQNTNNLGFRNGREQEGEVDEDFLSGEDLRKSVRASPLPAVCFSNSDELWELMCAMDLKYHKPPEIFRTNPILSPQMRAILIDWMMDVCEAYKMHRETLYLAIDYLDRYLASQKNIAKTVLQLIGITCLFVAAKLEEIYPPKLKTFAYVTDGACTESEILDMELVLMKTLKWKLTPITPVGWISIYLQVLAYRSQGIYCTRSGADSFLRSTLHSLHDSKPDDFKLVKYIYDIVEFVKAMRLVDLAIVDTYSLKYSYATLAAAAIYHTKGRTDALKVSGFKWTQLAPCVHWMAPFALVLKRYEIPSVLNSVEGISDDTRHLIQTYCISLDMHTEAEGMRTSKICSPLTHTEGLLTPPRSSEKIPTRFCQ